MNEPHDIELTSAFNQSLTELSITTDGVIIRDHRVIIPQSLQQRVKVLAHVRASGHS